MFCSAIVKPKVAAEIPKSSVIGRMNRPRLWRSPMHSEMISPLKRISSSIARRLSGVAMDFPRRYTGRCTYHPTSGDPPLARSARNRSGKIVRLDGQPLFTGEEDDEDVPLRHDARR